MDTQHVNELCDALPGCRSTNSVHTDPQPFRFSDLPAELRNNIYNLAADCSCSDGRHDIFHMDSGDATSQLQRNWGFIGLTQASHCTREEFRPIYMSKITLVVTLSDLPAFTETFLTNILGEPRSAPNSVQVGPCMRRRGDWRPVKFVDLAPFLRIMCACKLSRYVFLSEWPGDWLPPFLNAAGTTRTASWTLALNRHIDQFEVNLEREINRRRVRIFVREEAQGGIENNWYMPHWSVFFVPDENDPAVHFLNRLGVQEQGNVLDDIWFIKRGKIPANRAWRRQDRSAEVSLEHCCLYTS